jgi:hypothetical protein
MGEEAAAVGAVTEPEEGTALVVLAGAPSPV